MCKFFSLDSGYIYFSGSSSLRCDRSPLPLVAALVMWQPTHGAEREHCCAVCTSDLCLDPKVSSFTYRISLLHAENTHVTRSTLTTVCSVTQWLTARWSDFSRFFRGRNRKSIHKLSIALFSDGYQKNRVWKIGLFQRAVLYKWLLLIIYYCI